MEANTIPNTIYDRIRLIQRIQDYLTTKFQVNSGCDSNQVEYESIQDMWRCEGFFDQEKASLAESQWYKKSHNYWEDDENVQATIDGILGGFAHLSERDIRMSEEFLITHVLETLPVL